MLNLWDVLLSFDEITNYGDISERIVSISVTFWKVTFTFKQVADRTIYSMYLNFLLYSLPLDSSM